MQHTHQQQQQQQQVRRFSWVRRLVANKREGALETPGAMRMNTRPVKAKPSQGYGYENESMYSMQQMDDDASTRAMISDHESCDNAYDDDNEDIESKEEHNEEVGYNDEELAGDKTSDEMDYNVEYGHSTFDETFDSHSRYPTSSKSTALTSMASAPVNPLVLSNQYHQNQPTVNSLLVNPGVGAPSVHSMVTGVTRNDSASVVTIASSTRDWRRRRSIDTNVSTSALAPGSIINVATTQHESIRSI